MCIGQREFDFSTDFSADVVELLIKFLYAKSLGMEFKLESSKHAFDLLFLCKTQRTHTQYIQAIYVYT